MSLPNNRKLSAIPSRKVKSVPVRSLQSIQSVTDIKKNFIFFGCWNNVDCKNVLDYRDRVLLFLKNLKPNNKIILAGDNWYSQKRDNSKYYLPEVLKSGYEKLFDVSKDISIVLGNHDINKPKGNKLCEDLGCMLFLQVKAIQDILVDLKSSYNLDVTEMSIKPIYKFNKVKLYSCEPKLVKQYNSNVYFLYLNTNVFLEDTEYIDNYIAKIEALLKSKYISLLFIVGHHPFFSFKPKGDEDISKHYKGVKELYFKKEKCDDKVQAIYRFLDVFAKYTSIYLCADVHNFQICKLHRNIIMITCGTGGANKDKVDESIVSHLKTFTLNDSYTVTDLYVHNSYGFSDIKYNSNNIIVDYYKINDNTYSIFSYEISLPNLKIKKLGSQEDLRVSFLSTSMFSSIEQSRVRHKTFCEKSTDLKQLLGTYNSVPCGIKEK